MKIAQYNGKNHYKYRKYLLNKKRWPYKSCICDIVFEFENFIFLKDEPNAEAYLNEHLRLNRLKTK